MEEKTMTAPAAEEGKKPATVDTAKEPKTPDAGAPAAKSYDQDYIDRLLDEQAKAREAAVAEALKVAGMDAEKKAAYEKEQAEKRQAQREADVARRELKADAREVLDEKGVPKEFLEILLGKDMKETKANVDTFKTVFDAAVQSQVEKRLAGKTPSTGSGASTGGTSTMAAEIDKYL